MNHLNHIVKNKELLILRSQITKLVREFFWSQDFLEVETPLILKLPGQEPYLSPVKTAIHNEFGVEFPGYLHTSPEYAMKKLLGAGFEKIFSLGKCFRDYESFGGTHNPEFTMIEWYRANADMYKLMDDCEDLYKFIYESLKDQEGLNNSQFQAFQTFNRISMKDLWQQEIGVNLDDYLTIGSMFKLCEEHSYKPSTDEKYEDLFFRIFLNEIEPKLSGLGAIFIYNYPAQMAALARLCPTDPRYAERFELYINGLELANAFSELTDPVEQKKRLAEEQELRKTLGKPVFDIDEEFISALGHMPPSTGIALGIDRLVMILTGCKNIDDVLLLSANDLFS
jgi:lysyl-tRNA synthetase class 2